MKVNMEPLLPLQSTSDSLLSEHMENRLPKP